MMNKNVRTFTFCSATRNGGIDQSFRVTSLDVRCKPFYNVLLAVINAESCTKQLGVPKVDVKDPKLVKLVADDIQHALVMGAFLFAACCPFPFSFTFVKH